MSNIAYQRYWCPSIDTFTLPSWIRGNFEITFPSKRIIGLHEWFYSIARARKSWLVTRQGGHFRLALNVSEVSVPSSPCRPGQACSLQCSIKSASDKVGFALEPEEAARPRFLITVRTSAVDADASWRTAGMDGRDLARFAHSPSSKGIIRTELERNDLILRGSVSCLMLETSTYVCPSAAISSTFAITPTVEKSDCILDARRFPSGRLKSNKDENRGKTSRKKTRGTIRILEKKKQRSERTLCERKSDN